MPIESNNPPDPLFEELCFLTKMTLAEDIRDASLNEMKVEVVKGKFRKPHRLEVGWMDLRSIIEVVKRASSTPVVDKVNCVLSDIQDVDNKKSCPVANISDPIGSCDHYSIDVVDDTGNVPPCPVDVTDGAKTGGGFEFGKGGDASCILKKPVGPLLSVQFSNVVKSILFGKDSNGNGNIGNKGKWNSGLGNRFGSTIFSNQYSTVADRFAEKLNQESEEMDLKMEFSPNSVTKQDNGKRRIKFSAEEILKGGGAGLFYAIIWEIAYLPLVMGWLRLVFLMSNVNGNRLFVLIDALKVGKSDGDNSGKAKVGGFNKGRDRAQNYGSQGYGNVGGGNFRFNGQRRPGSFVQRNQYQKKVSIVQVTVVLMLDRHNFRPKVLVRGSDSVSNRMNIIREDVPVKNSLQVLDDQVMKDKEDYVLESMEEEYKSEIWPNLMQDVINVMESGVYPSKTVCTEWSLAQIDYFYKNCIKYGMDPLFEDEDVATEDGRLESFVTTGMGDFRDCLGEIRVEDLVMSGLKFTWNKSLGRADGLLKKLDRVMCNGQFVERFINANAQFLPFMASDHTPAVIEIPVMQRAKPKPFKFANFLVDKKEFLPIVKEVWESHVSGHAMFSVVSKLKLLKKPLRKLKKREIDCLNVYKDAMRDEELMLKQRAKVGAQFVKHFQIVFGDAKKVLPIFDPDSLFCKRFPPDDVEFMVRLVTNDEIKAVVFGMTDDKASEPDGFSHIFFKSSWSIIGNVVCIAMRDFFKNGRHLQEVNAMIIALVPKSQTPQFFFDFGPISCCNVLYKVITKIIANRIKDFLGNIADECQNAFIPSRQITDNVYLTHLLMRNYHKNHGPLKVAFKIDIHKAYDSGKRGLRQGDPLSPYLFMLVMEVFSLMVRKKIDDDGGLKYHWRCDRLKITHLSFADDLMVFSKADVNSVKILSSALKEFSSVSGLVPNLDKRLIFFGNVPKILKSKILKILSLAVGILPVRYLGHPLISSRLCKHHCSNLLDKIKKRLFNWKNKSLSFAGRLLLIKSVVSSIQVYWASTFILPKAVNAEIEKLMRRFLWSHGDLCKGHAKDSLLVKWVSTYRLIDRSSNFKNFWDVPVLKDCCWGWRKILQCREVLKNHIIYQISDRDIYEAGLPIDCKVNDIVKNGVWKWHESWRCKFPFLFNLPHPLLFQGRNDRVIWKSNDGKVGNFSVKSVWSDLAVSKPMVPWSKLVWFSQNIPRHAFILWIAIYQKLKTHDRIEVCLVKLDSAPWSLSDLVCYMVGRPVNRSIWSILQRLVACSNFGCLGNGCGDIKVLNVCCIWSMDIGYEVFWAKVEILIEWASCAIFMSWACSSIRRMDVLDMDARSNMYGKYESFRYHRYCKDVQLINVCFGDDLFIFARGDVESSRVIMDSLEEFKLSSGLVLSIHKNTAYFCNVLPHTKAAILSIMPFLKGELLVKYLGVPLISLRLLDKDCKILVEKTKNIIRDWKNKSLSFARRLQLCQSRDRNGSFSSFSVAKAWEAISRGMQVDWFRIVWFSYNIPCHAFHLWLVIRNGLKMHDKMRQWDVGTKFVPLILYDNISYLQPMGNKRTARSVFDKLILASSAYFIWMERNHRTFKNTRRSPEEVRDLIMVTARLKLITLRFKDITMVKQLLDKWKLPANFRLYED
uniref:Reverse transcriptase domain-containing protein n=1 Tax=Tanacetum cinerariifolium TaxID=118510 RepID=A0A699H5R9_TANCI|nr:hypothetical protein [Tanacetum cinerariifolium]